MENELEMRWIGLWMMRQRREVSKDEEEITVKRSEGGKLQVEKVQHAPELAVHQTHMKKRDAGKERKRKIAGWSTKMLKETANKSQSVKTRRKWCSGDVSARRAKTGYGSSCVA